jgi:protein gp37
MGKDSKIPWCHHTFNHVRGCSRVSEGCRFCYAEALSKRNPAIFGKWGDKGTRVVASEAMWKNPVRWNLDYKRRLIDSDFDKETVERHRVFCASVADVFEDWQGPIWDSRGLIGHVYEDGDWGYGPHMRADEVSNWTVTNASLLTMNDLRRRLFGLIDTTPNLDWLLLTKRPENIRKMTFGSKPKLSTALKHKAGTPEANIWHRNNVWLGTTVENQEQADKRTPELLKCADLSPVLWLSIEPMLGEIDLGTCLGAWNFSIPALRHAMNGKRLIEWVVCGCEQGPQHKPLRPMNLDWARSLRDQCQAAGVAFFMKQMEVNGRVTDDMNDFPQDLQVREFPR